VDHEILIAIMMSLGAYTVARGRKKMKKSILHCGIVAAIAIVVIVASSHIFRIK